MTELSPACVHPHSPWWKILLSAQAALTQSSPSGEVLKCDAERSDPKVPPAGAANRPARSNTGKFGSAVAKMPPLVEEVKRTDQEAHRSKPAR